MNRSRIEFFRNRCTWLEPSAPIHYEVVEGFIAMSDRWMKPDGAVVESPGMAKYVVKTRAGWCIKYGANSFHVEDAVRLAAKELRAAYDRLIRGNQIDIKNLERRIQDHFSRVVSHETNGRYAHYARVEDDLVFGTHFIDTVQGARFLIAESGLTSALQPDRARRQAHTTTSRTGAGREETPSAAPNHAKPIASNESGTGAAEKSVPGKRRQRPAGERSATPEDKAVLRVHERRLQALVDSTFNQLKTSYPFLAHCRVLRRRARRVLFEFYSRTGPDPLSVPDSVAKAVHDLRSELDQAANDPRRRTQTAATPRRVAVRKGSRHDR